MQLSSTNVALMAHPTYEQSLMTAVDRLLFPCFAGVNLRGARVVLKPNLITTTNGHLSCTDGRLIEAAAAWFLTQGARVGVGDSPSFGSARAVLAAIGALPRLQRLSVPIVEFRHKRPIKLPSGREAPLATAALDCDFLVNMPKIKAHSQMRLTLAVKNYFGCVLGFHKPWWHMIHGGSHEPFARLLVDLLTVLPPGCSLVDGIMAMHGTGPIHGGPYPLGLLAAATNPVAVDTALLAVLGVDPRRCPLWLAAHGAGIRGTREEELSFTLLAPGAFAVDDFIVPEELAPVRFNPVRFVKSSLQRALLRVLG